MEPLRFALDSFIGTTQRRVTGKVRLKFYKGGHEGGGSVLAELALPAQALDLPEGSTFDQASAVGFIELWGLQSRIAAERDAETLRRRTGEERG